MRQLNEDYEDQFHTWRNYAVGHLAPYFISGGDRDNDGTNAANGDDAQTVYEINYFGNMAPQHHDNFILRSIKAHHGARSAGKRLQTVARHAGHLPADLSITTTGEKWITGKGKSATTPVGRGMMKPPRRGQKTIGTRSKEH